jgi:CubicO group peptidase (beta-lactamase class C family)
MLHSGQWNGKQVIPPWFVAEVCGPHPTHNVTTPELRWGLRPAVFTHGWERPRRHFPDSEKYFGSIPEDAVLKSGSGGQLMAFVPSLDLVVTRQTGGSGEWQYEEFLAKVCECVL